MGTSVADKVAEYIRSIELADATLGGRVWATTPDVSFIHPRGHERGWDQVAANFYGKTMGESFLARTLKQVGDLAIHFYKGTAVVEFDWDFVAVRRDNRRSLHTTGRETQVYVEFPENGWHLVHVHYSGPPQTGAGEGF